MVKQNNKTNAPNATKLQKNKIYNNTTKKFEDIFEKKNGKTFVNKKVIRALRKDSKSFVIPKGYYFDKKRGVLDNVYKKGVVNKKLLKTLNLEDAKTIVLSPNQVLNYNTGKLIEKSNVKEYKKTYKQEGQVIKKKFAGLKFEPLLNENKKTNSGLTVGNVFNIGGLDPRQRLGTSKQIEEYYENLGKLNDGEEVSAEVNTINDRIEQFIESIKTAAKEKFAGYRKDSGSILLRFGDGEDYRWFRLEDVDNLIDTIVNWKTSAFGSDNESASVVSGENLNMDWFRLSFTSKANLKASSNEKVSSKYWYCDQPKTKDNMCVEGALKRFLDIKDQTKTMRNKIMVFSNGDIKWGEGIHLDKLHYYEDFYKINIEVYEDTPHYNNDNCLVYSKNKYVKTAKILYKDNHASAIVRPKLKISELNKYDKKKFGVYKQPKQTVVNYLDKKEMNRRKEVAVIFDIETVFDKNNYQFLKTYGISWVVWDLNEEFVYDPKIHTKEPYCYYECGEESLKKFIKFLLNPPSGIIYRPIGFNNSRFDNYAFCDTAADMGVLNNVFMADGSILYCAIEGVKNVWDASRFLVGMSLDGACKSYKTTPAKAKDLIDHYQIQTYFEKKGMDGLVGLLKKNDDLVLYNKLDCLCLLDLVIKMRNAYKKLYEEDIMDYLTISSMSYKIQEKIWDGTQIQKKQIKNDKSLSRTQKIEAIQKLEPNFIIQKPKTYLEDKFFRDSLTAGRTQSFYGAMTYNGELAMCDVKSLYPTVMGNYGGNVCPFPLGDYKYTNKYLEGKLGIYRVNIIHQRCKWTNQEEVYKQFKIIKEVSGVDLYRQYAPNVIALREKDKPLNWFYKGKIESINLTSVDIEVIKNTTGDKNCIEVMEGYYWEECSTNLFKGYLDPPKKEKTLQDKYKEEGDKNYNVALREGCKAISNCLSGKLLECLHEDINKVFSVKNYLEMVDDETIEDVEIMDYGGGLSFINGKKNVIDSFEDMKDKSKKPSYLGMFVYSYARKLMYEKILGKYITLYMDTDSACMPMSEWDRMSNENGYELMENGEYGCLEEEVCEVIKCKECKNFTVEEEITFRKNNKMVGGLRCKSCKIYPATKLIAISPKNYAVINEHNENFCKRKFKGVRKTDYFLPLSYFGEYKVEEKLNLKTGIVSKECKGTAVDKIRGNNKGVKPMTQDEIRRYREHNCCVNCIEDVLDNKSKCKECISKSKLMKKSYTTEMFEYLVKGEKIAVFCSMINRIKYSLGGEVDWCFGKDVNYTPNIEELQHLFNANSEEKQTIIMNYNKEKNELTSSRELQNVFKLKQAYLIKII